MFTCRWCGETYDDNEPIDRAPDGSGFWCDNCDGFTFLDPKDQAKQRFLLLLEQKAQSPLPSSSHQFFASPLPYLRKQLSPLRYPGGKSKLIDYLFSKLASEKLDTLVEVFAGGASFGLSLLDAGIIQRLILNDIDPGVYALWNTILDKPHELTDRLRGPFPTHQDLALAKERLTDPGTPTPLLAWSFLLSNLKLLRHLQC